MVPHCLVYELVEGCQVGLALYWACGVDQGTREVQSDGQGTFKSYEAHLEIVPCAQPRYNKARTIPYSKRKAVEDELDRLVAEGTLEPVEYSDSWADLIVAVLS